MEKHGIRILLEGIPVGILMMDGNGRFRYINPKFKELFGFDLQEVPDGKTWMKKAYPDPSYRHKVVAAWKQDLQQAIPGERTPRTFTVTCADGSRKSIYFIAVQLEETGILIMCEDVTERMVAEESLRYRLEFEKLIMTISTNFINLAPENIDSEINRALEAIGNFAKVDRSYVFLFFENERTMDNTHEWCAPGIEPQVHRLKGLSIDEAFPWFLRFMMAHRVFYVPRVSELPDEAWRERQEFQRENIQSLLVVPMIYGSSPVGFVGFDSVTSEKVWSEDTISLLKIIGEVFCSALERKRTEEALKKREESEKRLSQENAVMAEIGRIVNSTLNIDEVYERAAEEVGKLITFDRLVVNINNLNERTVVIAYVTGPEVPGRRKGDVFPFSDSLNEEVTRTRSGILIQTENERELEIRFPSLMTTYRAGFRSILSVPLFSKDRLIGVLHFRHKKAFAYTERDLSLAEKVAQQIAGAIANAQLFVERKQAEVSLRESEEKYRQLVENAPVGIYEVDLGSYSLVGVNDVVCEVMGYSREELLSMNPLELVVGESRERLLERTKRILSGKKVPDSEEFKLRTRNGREFWALVNTKLLCRDGKPFKAQVVAQDISERKDLEEQLIQAQKMEAVGRLAGGVAHDFNNLLTVINGYCQLSLTVLGNDDPLRKNIEEIEKAAERGANLTRQLLAFSRRQIMELKVLNLNAVLQDLDKMLRRLIGEDIDLLTDLAEDLGQVKTDPGQMEQVILNLAVNARDAMPHGGKLVFETENVTLDNEYVQSHMDVVPGRYVRLSVSDTGYGISPEVKQRIFEPFFTTKEKGKGTGLGLSTVYGIVKQSGGYIRVYSEQNRGTTFKIYLPWVEEEAAVSPRPVASPEFLYGVETLLLVEDEPLVRQLAARTLRRQGYTVLEAAGGEEAIQLLNEASSHGEIHLLLTDVVMPAMGGRELADRVKAMKPDIKVLFMSGYTDDAIVNHGILIPGIAFLEKPFSTGTLSRKVREVLDHSPVS